MSNLATSLLQKRSELAARLHDLETREYHGNLWVLAQVKALESQIAVLEGYQSGPLALPPCCNDAGAVCLLAVHGFTECVWPAKNCGYNWRP